MRANAKLAGQTGLAAGLAWYVAHDLIGHPVPIFAPIAAVVVLAVSIGQRLRRATELVFGVAIGIGVGDLLIYVIGTGPWQIGLVVAAAIIVAVFGGAGSSLVSQAGSSAVLVATLTPPGSAASGARFIDSLVGGLLGLGVMALLLPLNPLRVVQRSADPLLGEFADALDATAAALRRRDADAARSALARLRALEGALRQLGEAIQAGRETVTLSPARWGARSALKQYVDAAEYLGYALRNSRVLVRRVITAVDDGERVPDGLPSAVATIAVAITRLRHEFAAGAEPERAREETLRAVRRAAEAYRAGVGFSGSVIVAQIRATAVDLLRASGLSGGDSYRLVREMGGPAPPAGADPSP